MSEMPCSICNSKAILIPENYDGQVLSCSRCGNFRITSSAHTIWNANTYSIRQIANASGWIRENQNININSEQITFLASIQAPSINERATKILLAISKVSTGLDFRFDISSILDQSCLVLSYSSNFNEVRYLFQTYLKDELNLLSFTLTEFLDSEFIFSDVYITPKGHAYLESLNNTNSVSQIGFCAMWFNEEVLPIWTSAISRAIRDSGYEPKRIDSHHHNNRIDDEIIMMLRRSKFVVADFTGQRGGVYFEAGFALGLGLKVIFTCEKSELENNHFDTRQYNFVTWERDKLDEFKTNLQNRIEATLGRGKSS